MKTSQPRPRLCRRRIYAAFVLLALAVPGARAAAPSALVGVFSGASQNSAWGTGNSDPVDIGFAGEQAAKSGRTVWEEELKRVVPGLAINTASKVKAGVGFVGHWWTEAGGLTADGTAVREALLARLQARPEAAGFVCHVLASAAYNEAPPERFRAELAGYATALHDAVDTEFGAGKRAFTFWWLEAGNRWGNPEGGQSTAAERRRVPVRLASELTFFRVAPGTMAYVIGDWNPSGDGIHYPRASNQRAGRQLAYSLLLHWGERLAGLTRELRIESAQRDRGDPHAILVHVLTNGGMLFASPHPCRVSTADGKGVGVGSQGTLNASEWVCTVDNRRASEKVATVRLRHARPLPVAPLFFSHTWGTWHTVSPGRPGYTGPLAVWHEDCGGGTGLTQDFADLTAVPRSMILMLGTAHLIPVAEQEKGR
jgi:hypothetical protein